MSSQALPTFSVGWSKRRLAMLTSRARGPSRSPSSPFRRKSRKYGSSSSSSSTRRTGLWLQRCRTLLRTLQRAAERGAGPPRPFSDEVRVGRLYNRLPVCCLRLGMCVFPIPTNLPPFPLLPSRHLLASPQAWAVLSLELARCNLASVPSARALLRFRRPGRRNLASVATQPFR